jgi:cephalosporin hydroxylase
MVPHELPSSMLRPMLAHSNDPLDKRLREVSRRGKRRIKRLWTVFHYWVERRLERVVVALAYRRLHYSSACIQTRWLGSRALKNPLDLWIYQEIINETRPDVIVETGTAHGGSAAYLASICELLESGEVISIDIAPVSPDYPKHPRITYLGGRSSTVDEVVKDVRKRTEGKRTMVILDSDHSERHVTAELEVYAPLVSPGCFLLVEDTIIGLVDRDELPGPAQAVKKFLSRSGDFEVDTTRERYLLTSLPGGYLRRREVTT